MASGISLKIGSMQDSEARAELSQLGRDCTDEHVPDEQRMPCVRRDESDRQAVGRICTGEEILNENLTGIEVGAHILLQSLERLGLEPSVLFPPDAIAGARLLHQKLVFGRAAGMRGRNSGEGAAVGEGTFTPPNRVLEELRWREVRMNPDGKEAVLDKREIFSRGCRGFSIHPSNLDSHEAPCNLIAALWKG
jgi:hypothetical protein